MPDSLHYVNAVVDRRIFEQAVPCKGNVAPYFFAEKTVHHYTFVGRKSG